MGEPRRLWFDDDEIERLVTAELMACQAVDAASPDLEALAELRFNVALDQHAILPATILGCTEFRSHAPCRVLINRALTLAMEQQPTNLSVVGRWRATLAHELGHVLLHRALYAGHEEEQIELLPTVPGALETQGVRCFRKDIGIDLRAGDWREVQANKAMASFLMPRARVARAVERMIESMRNKNSSTLVDRIAEQFSVSRQVAVIRLRELGLPKALGTLF